LFFGLLALAQAEPTLVGVNFLSRHGTRSANQNILQICPNYATNLNWYVDTMKIGYGELTPKGMVDLNRMGEFAHSRYVNETGLLSTIWDPNEHYAQAVGVDRTMQSAMFYGYGLYGKGSNSPVLPIMKHGPAAFPFIWFP